MYIADPSNHLIRRVDVTTGIISTIAGSGGTGSYSGDDVAATTASLYSPYGVAVDSAGTDLEQLLHFNLITSVLV